MKTIQHNAFSGKRVRQNSSKLKAIKKRERRLNRIGLSVLAFANGFSYAAYEEQRKAGREAEKRVEDKKK